MTMRRAIALACFLLVLFLGVYTWNRESHVLDDVSTQVGLEVTGLVLEPLAAVKHFFGDIWDHYFNLVGVREENIRLQARVKELEATILANGEDLAELKRLRALVDFPVDIRWRPLVARVLAGRIGPNAVLESITISRGYANGARPGVPLVTNLGLVGRVLRSSAHASTVLLITDPGSRVAVFGQETRAPGILKGRGMGQSLEVDFVQRDLPMKNGEVLVTSGLDNKFPKGLPVAVVSDVSPSDYTEFMAVAASPLVDLQHLEEVLLLEKSGLELPAYEEEFVGPPLPPESSPAEPVRTAGIPAQNPPSAPTPAPQAPVDQQATSSTPPRAPTPADRQISAEPPASQPQARRTLSAPDPTDPSRPAPLNREGAPMYRVIVP